MHIITHNIKFSGREYLFLSVCLLLSLVIGLLAIYLNNLLITIAPALVLLSVLLLILIFRNPLTGLILLLTYCFFMAILNREIGQIPFGTGVEVIVVLTWLSVWYNASGFEFKVLNNDLIWLMFAWFAISVVQIINPSGASPQGWLQEIRSTALAPVLITPLAILLINSKRRLNLFLVLILTFSFLASLNGLKQLFIALSPGEEAFLAAGGAETHVINGQLRIFSFYSDASQFGPMQALIGLIALILAVGLNGWIKKLLLFSLAILSFYGMIISGTRGAFFVVAIGIIAAIILSRNLKVIVFGGGLSLAAFVFLKYTYIGNANYNIYRLRSSLDPSDASLNMRIINQQKLNDYLAAKPFGEGLGIIGHWGREYNPGHYLSTIAPDSYWVKVWAMYGIIGFVIFFCLWMYILGKGAGMIWKVNDKNLRTKLTALYAGIAGIFVCSYGNEVMNAMPALIVFQMSAGIIYVMCAKYIQTNKQ